MLAGEHEISIAKEQKKLNAKKLEDLAKLGAAEEGLTDEQKKQVQELMNANTELDNQIDRQIRINTEAAKGITTQVQRNKLAEGFGSSLENAAKIHKTGFSVDRTDGGRCYRSI